MTEQTPAPPRDPAADLVLVDPFLDRLTALNETQVERFRDLLTQVENLVVDDTVSPPVQGNLASSLRSVLSAGNEATSRLLTLKGDLQLATARDFMPPAG